jgi:hypothetical protein
MFAVGTLYQKSVALSYTSIDCVRLLSLHKTVSHYPWVVDLDRSTWYSGVTKVHFPLPKF